MTDGGSGDADRDEPRSGDDRDESWIDNDDEDSHGGPQDGDGSDEIDWEALGDADGGADRTGVDSDDVEVDVDPGLGADSEDPFAELDAGTDGDPDSEDPFAELDDDGGEESESDPFEKMDVGELDEDVWEALSEGDQEVGPAPAPEGVVGATPAEGGGVGATPVEDEGADDRPDHIVDKRQYCQSCPYFTEPPTTACEHEGTEIAEVTDTDHFRVRGCPMIAEEGPQFDRS